MWILQDWRTDLRFDPRTKLALGLMAIGAVFIAQAVGTVLLECVALLVTIPVTAALRTVGRGRIAAAAD